MLPEYLLPVTTIRESGVGPTITVRGGGEGISILTLGITRITEREGLRVSIWGSANQLDWGSMPLVSFTNKYYCGDYQVELDLSEHPNVRYIRVHWDVDCESRAGFPPMCTLFLRAHAPERHMAAMSA